jgi:hypothetical protein
MKCFSHPDKDAVGLCARCGKTVCTTCAKEFDEGVICGNCADALYQEAKEAEATERDQVVRHARRTILWSWVVTGVLGLFMIILTWSTHDSDLLGQKILMTLLFPYVVWSGFWGFVFILERWYKPSWGWGMWVFMVFIVWPFLSPYGGGIYQFLQYRRILKLLAQPSDTKGNNSPSE